MDGIQVIEGAVFDNNNTKPMLVDGNKLRTGITDRRALKPVITWKSKKLLIMLFLPYMTFGYVIFMPNFIYLTPKHMCAVDNQTFDSLSNFSSDGINQCYQQQSNKSVQQNDSVEQCTNGWVYDVTFGETVASEFDLVCDSAWKRPTLQCFFMIGILIGSLFASLSDRFGRRPLILISIAVGGVSLVVLSLAPSYYFFLAFISLNGVSHPVSVTAIYVRAQEEMSEQRRSLAALIINLSFGCGYLVLTLMAHYVRDWRWLVRIFGIVTLVNLPLVWQIEESPKWRLQKLNQVSCFEGEEVISKTNSTTVEDSSRILLTNGVLRRRLFMVCLLWNVTFFAFYTLSLNSANLGGDLYVNCVLGALVDIASYICMYPILKMFGRRNSIALCLFVCSVFCLLTPLLKNISEPAGMTCAMLGKFCATTSMSIVILFTGEIFPTLQRNTAIGIGSMSARVGSILSPILIFAGEVINLSIPFYVMGAVSIVAALMSLTLPETSKAPLPDTIKEAVALDKYKNNIKLGRLCTTRRRDVDHRTDSTIN